MITYMKLGKVRAISLELSKSLGVKPVFEKNTFHHETIIDIPYGQIIYTSEKWFPLKRSPKRRVLDGPVNQNVQKDRQKNGQENGKNHQIAKRAG